MLRSPLRVRAIAPMALAALALGMPSAAVAEPAPAPSPTTSASGSPAPSASADDTVAPSPTPTSTSTSTTRAPSPTGSPSTPAPSATATPSTSERSARTVTTEGTTKSLSAADALTPVPFTGAVARRLRLAGSPTEQAGYAGGYLARTLTAQDDHYTWPGTDFLDGGNTIDGILGLDGAKVGVDAADAALAYLEAHVDGYVGGGGETYAGPLGKLLIAVTAQGGDPTDFGGQDLVARLEALLEDGRFSDASAYGDYSNTIGHSLDLIALGRATGGADPTAVDYLLAQQCVDGGFRGTLAAPGGACASDLDATAFAAQALTGFGEEDAATGALEFLASKQQASGGLLNADGALNANTTGLAAQAFAAAGWADELAAAQGFLAGLQLDCAFVPELRGGIAFTAADRATLLKEPTNTAAIDKLLRSTPQATLGLAGGNLLDVTAEGATASAPAPTCATPTPTTPAPATKAPTRTTAAPVGHPVTDGPAASGDPRALAYTGASPVLPLAIAALLLLAGAAAILVSRRRGAHQ